MRILIIFILSISASVVGNSQNAIQGFIDKYGEAENFNHLTLQGSMLNFAANYSDSKEEQKVLTKINRINAIWTKDFNPIRKKDITSVLKSLRKDQFEPYIVAQNKGSNVNFLIQENGQQITGVVVLIDNADYFLLVQLDGKLRFEDLSEIDLEIEGMEHFKKLPKDRRKLKKA